MLPGRAKSGDRDEARRRTASGTWWPRADTGRPSPIALYGDGDQGSDAAVPRGVGHRTESHRGVRAWGIPGAGVFKRLHFAVAHAARPALFSRPRSIRSRT